MLAAGIVLGILTAVTGVIDETWRLNGLRLLGEGLLRRVVERVAVVAVQAALLWLHDGHMKGFTPNDERNDCRAHVEGALIGIERA